MVKKLPDPACESYEKEFRSKSIWHSFMATLYGAVAGAAFIGVLNEVVRMAIGAVGKAPEAVAEGVKAAGAAATGGSPLLTAAVMGGFVAVGVVFTLLSQVQYTELCAVRDEHLAKKNAECMGKEQAHGVTQAILNDGVQATEKKSAEYAQNKRSDGKAWVAIAEASAAQTQQVAFGK